MELLESEYFEGLRLAKQGNYKKALECLNTVVKNNKNHQKAWYWKGYYEFELNQYKDAIQSYDHSILMNPDAVLFTNKGSALDRLQKYQEAIDCFDQAIELNPRLAPAWNNKGSALNRLNKYEEAIKCCDQAIKLNPELDAVWKNKGEALYGLKNFQEAINCCDRAIQLNPKLETAQECKREALKGLGQYQQASSSNMKAQNALMELEEAKSDEVFKITCNKILAKLSPEEQIEKRNQFIQKLQEDQNSVWIKKVTELDKLNNDELYSYFNYMLPPLLSSSEATQIQIKQFTVISAGFSQIHFGIFSKELVAIKEQTLSQNDDDSYFLALFREITILIICNHQNIAKLFAIYLNPQRFQVQTVHPRYFMDLSKVLFSGQTHDIPNKHSIACQLFEALNYIHSIGIIHMDVKPQNFVFKSSTLKKIVLIDFGISKILRLNQNTDALGITYFYSPPEVKDHGKSKISSKSDIFSLAIVLYELVTEIRAWSKYLGQGPSIIYSVIRNSNLNFFTENQSTNNQELDKLIEDCTQQDPSQRPTAADALERIKLIQF